MFLHDVIIVSTRVPAVLLIVDSIVLTIISLPP